MLGLEFLNVVSTQIVQQRAVNYLLTIKGWTTNKDYFNLRLALIRV